MALLDSDAGILTATTVWPVAVTAGLTGQDNFAVLHYTPKATTKPTAPAGWTEREDLSSTGDRRTVIYTRTLAAGYAAGSINFTFGGAVSGYFITGTVDANYEDSDTSDEGYTAAPECPSLTATEDGSTLVTFVGVVQYPRVFTPPVGTVEAEDVGDGSANAGALGSDMIDTGASGVRQWASVDYYGNSPTDDAEVISAASILFKPAAVVASGDPVDFRAATQSAFTAASADLNRPAGLDGDTALMALNFKPKAAVITPPAGWLLVERVDSAAGEGGLAVYSFAYTADDATPSAETWGFDQSCYVAWGCASFSGTVGTSEPSDYGNATTFATGTIESTAIAARAVAISGTATWPRTHTTPGDWSEHVDIQNGYGPGTVIASRAANVETVTGPVLTPNIEELHMAVMVMINPGAAVTGNTLSGSNVAPYFARPANVAVVSNAGGFVGLSWDQTDASLGARFYVQEVTDPASDYYQLQRLSLPPGTIPITAGKASATVQMITAEWNLKVAAVNSEGVESALSNEVNFTVTDGETATDGVYRVVSGGPYMKKLSEGGTITVVLTAYLRSGAFASGEALIAFADTLLYQLQGDAVTVTSGPAAATDGSGQVTIVVAPAAIGIGGVRIQFDGFTHTESITITGEAAEGSGIASPWSKPTIRRS